jgi:hypothetical protein
LAAASEAVNDLILLQDTNESVAKHIKMILSLFMLLLYLLIYFSKLQKYTFFSIKCLFYFFSCIRKQRFASIAVDASLESLRFIHQSIKEIFLLISFYDRD